MLNKANLERLLLLLVGGYTTHGLVGSVVGLMGPFNCGKSETMAQVMLGQQTGLAGSCVAEMNVCGESFHLSHTYYGSFCVQFLDHIVMLLFFIESIAAQCVLRLSNSILSAKFSSITSLVQV